jgi:argininosuccinate synthase
MKEKVVLAYSGGLDTSFCVKYLSDEKGLDVYSAIANTGAFTKEELSIVSDKAYALGVTSHITLDIENEYYNDYIRFMVFGNILKNGTYPLSVSSERTVQALAIAKYAKSIGAKFIAHGSTGAGNDQVRFDLVFSIMVPEIEIITPIRDLSLSRDAEIKYLKEKGVKADWTKMAYSINKGLWGTSVGGKETLTSNMSLPENAYPTHLKKEGNEIITLGFVNGEVVEVNGQHFINPIDAIREIDKLTSAYAIGRDMHVGDTIIGIKGRVGFEAPAPMVIIKAHHTLEKHVLTKWQQYWKEQLSNWYGMLLHEGQYLDPVMRNIEKFMIDTQETVTGKVFVKLMPYHFNIEGIESDYDLMNAGSGLYGEMSGGWSGDDVKGFTKLLGNQLKIYQSVKDKNAHKTI